MTREEAEKIVGRGLYPGTSQLTFSVAGFVNLLDRLGVLKLDKPVPIKERVWAALFPVRINYTTPEAIEKLLDEAGLKVIEK